MGDAATDMSDIEAKARKVLAALEAKPDLFFEVHRLAQDEFMIAGPWVPGAGCWTRFMPNGEIAGLVMFKDGRTVYVVGNEQDEVKGGDVICARNIVDQHLDKAGYLLARSHT